MEYIVKIVKEERISKQFWKYTFIDIKTSKEDWFVNNYSLRYTPDLIGKLKLSWDKKQRCKLYQDFNQNIADLKETVKEEELGLWEKKFERNIEGIESELTRRPIKFFKTHQELVKFLEGLHEMDKRWEKTAERFKKSDRTLRRWRKEPILSLQKVGPKFKIDRNSFYHLIHSFQTEKAKTLKKASKYVSEKTGLQLSLPTIFRILKKISYSHQVIPYRNPQQKQNLVQVIDFMEKVNKLPPKQILSTDESGFPLNLTLRKGWGIKGQKITRFKKHYATNYTLLLCIRNIEKGGIIHWDLSKEAVNTDIFTNFINNIELPDKERCYLLIDKLSSHRAKKVKETLAKKNIEPCYIVSANPWLNPIEEIFHVIKDYVRKSEPKTKEKLEEAITKIINMLNQQDLRKYFKDCLDFDFILKTGH